MTSARNRATTRTRRVNTALVAGAVFASVGVGSALVGNQIATSNQQTDTATGTGTHARSTSNGNTGSASHQSGVKKFFNGLLGGGSSSGSNNQSHATSSGS
ncbi:MAG: hypothetical protein KDB63_13090 [Nocardioidaceae bacterium]|nr:hypothetical protein [Nocardioidaceae bacterium]